MAGHSGPDSEKSGKGYSCLLVTPPGCGPDLLGVGKGRVSREIEPTGYVCMGSHVTMEADNSKICRMGQHAGDPGVS